VGELKTTTLEAITAAMLDVRHQARVCKDGDLMLAMARLRDVMAKAPQDDPLLQARYQTLGVLLNERAAGRNLRVWWAAASAYLGPEWAVKKLTRLDPP
jgi:ParB-like chromosome segregation protein Spo0J